MVRNSLFPTPDVMPSGTLAADSTAVISFPLGRRYHAFTMILGDSGVASAGLTSLGTTPLAADVITFLDRLCGLVTIKIGDKPQRTHLASELFMLNVLNGTAWGISTTGTVGASSFRMYLTIWFAEPWRNNNKAVADCAWNVIGEESFKLEVIFKSGIISPVLLGNFDWDGVTANSLGAISKVLRKGLTASGTYNDFDHLERKDFVQTMIFLPTVEGTPKYVQYLTVKVDNDEIRGRLSVTDNQEKLLRREMNPDTAAVPRFEYVIDYTDRVGDWLNLNGVNSFSLKAEYNASANGGLTLLMQTVGPKD